MVRRLSFIQLLGIREQVAIVESVFADYDLSFANGDRVAEVWSSIDEGVELPVFAARVHSYRQVS